MGILFSDDDDNVNDDREEQGGSQSQLGLTEVCSSNGNIPHQTRGTRN